MVASRLPLRGEALARIGRNQKAGSPTTTHGIIKFGERLLLTSLTWLLLAISAHNSKVLSEYVCRVQSLI